MSFEERKTEEIYCRSNMSRHLQMGPELRRLFIPSDEMDSTTLS